MNEVRTLARLAAALALTLLARCTEAKPGSNRPGTTPPSPEPTLVAGTLTGAEPFTIGTAPLDAATATVRRDETANAGSAGVRLGMTLLAQGTVTGAFGTATVVVR